MQAWMTLRVVKKWREATDIFSFELAAPDGQALPPFTAGAHIDVEVQPGLVRQYSLCNAPGGRDRYQIGVLREPESRGGSVAMVDAVQEGQDIRVSEPRNHFELESSARKSVLIAGGIGVTPILCMAERLAHAGEPFEMHYAVRSADRAAFKERIAAAHLADKVQLHVDDGLEAQRLNLDAILSDPAPGAHLYVCGPGGLIEATLAAAKAKGWPDSRVHREYFAPVAVTDAADPEQFQVKLASSGQTLTVPADKSIVQVLAEAGIDVPVSCEQGVCGTCVTRVLEGQPDHRDFFLTGDEQARGDQMTVCCSRAKTPLLVLDL